MPPNARRSKIAAAELGVASHVTIDGGPAIWEGFVKPFVWAGEAIRASTLAGVGSLPDRRRCARSCQRSRYPRHRPRLHRHGQRHRCASIWRCEGERRLRHRRPDPRNPEGAQRSPRLRAGHTSNNVASGCAQSRRPTPSTRTARPDHVRWRDRSLGQPGEGARGWCAPRSEWPAQPLRVGLRFVEGQALALDGETMPGAQLLAK